MNNLWTGGGASVALGKQLGKGGEGSVFDVPAQPKLVAKLYHSAPNPQKQDKLRFMVANGHKDLLAYSAWPVETLHQSRGGPVVGFLMERVSQKQPVHMLYSPAHRKQDYPKAAWDFLLYAARNTATAFEAVHRHGHVLGEPTTGLHFADIELLLRVLSRLRDHGNTIVVIEHNLDVIKTADWIVDIGPEGGASGGQIIASGTPEQVASTEKSHTGRYLAPLLQQK